MKALRPAAVSALLTTSACLLAIHEDDALDDGAPDGTETSTTMTTSTADGAATGGPADRTTTTTAPDTQTTQPSTCGWGTTGDPTIPEGYVCGGDGFDPSGQIPHECPAGLEAGASCGTVTGEGCCDAAGDVWYCTGDQTLYREACG